MAVIFPKTMVDEFHHTNKHKRWGQAFYDYAKLHKCHEPADVAFSNKLYNCIDEQKAKNMVASRTDESQ